MNNQQLRNMFFARTKKWHFFKPIFLGWLFVFTIWFAGSVLAVRAATAPPNIISYQGRILNANGVPISDASASIVFLFYDDPTAGTCLWSNSSATCVSTTARTVTLTDGLFSENLGDISASPAYAAINDTVFANNAAVYLEVRIGGETLSPRKRVVTSPYAINSQTLDGFDSADYLRATASDTYEGSSSRTLTVESLLSAGTRSASVLSITQANNTTYDFTGTTTSALFNVQQNDTGSSGDTAYLLNQGTGASFRVDDASGDTTPLIIDASGNFVMGATSTTNYFDIQNNTASDIVFSLDNTGDFVVRDAGAAFLILTDTRSYSYILDGTDNPTYTITNNGSGNVITNLAGTGDFIVQDNGTAIATFADTGAITLAPTSGQNVSATTAGTGIFSLTHGGTSDSIFNLSSTGDLVFQDAGTAFLTLSDTGTITENLTTTSATGHQIQADSLTTGVALLIGSDSNAFSDANALFVEVGPAAASTSMTGDVVGIQFTPTYSTAVTTPSMTGNVMNVTRNTTTNSSFASTLTVSGTLAFFQDSSTATTGTITSTADVVQIAQNYTSNSGAALDVTTGGTGPALRVNDNGSFTDSTPLIVDASGNFVMGATSTTNYFDIQNNTGGNIQFDLDSTGDFVVRDANTAFFTLSDNGAYTYILNNTDNPAYTITNNGSGEIITNLVGTGGIQFQDNGTDFASFTAAGAVTFTLDSTDNPAYTITNNGSGNVITNLAGTGDFIVQDNGTAIVTFADTGAITLAPTSGQNVSATTAGTGIFSLTHGGTSDSIFNLSSTGDLVFQDAGSGFLTLSDTGSYAYTLDSTDNPAYTITNNGSGNVITNLAGTGDFIVQDNGAAYVTFSDAGNTTIAQTAATTGSPTGFTFTGGAHTGLTASTEAIDVNFNLNRTVQFATGALTTQRAFVIDAPTYGFVGASTLSTTATAQINGPPIVGTNATIDVSVGLLVGAMSQSSNVSKADIVYNGIFITPGISNSVGNVQERAGLVVTGNITNDSVSLGNQTATLNSLYGLRVDGITYTSTTNTRTVTTAASLYIEGPPVNGGNVTFTSGPYAILVDTGSSVFDGDVVVGGSTSRVETLDNAGFSLGGDDLFVAGMAGIEGNIYTDGDLNLSGGDFNVVLDAGVGVDITKGAAPSVDVFTIDNSDQDSATDGVDLLVLNMDIADDTSGNIIKIIPEFIDDDGDATGGDTWNIIEIDSVTATLSAAVGATLTNTLNGLKVGQLTESVGGDETITSTALNIGTGWDYGAIFNSGSVGIGTTPTAKLHVSFDPGPDIAGIAQRIDFVGEDSGADQVQIALVITQGDNGMDKDIAADALIVLENNDPDDAVGSAINISTGSFVFGLRINSTGVDTDLNLQNGETIDNNVDDQINLNTPTDTATDGIYIDSGATTSTAFGLCHSGADADNAAFTDRQIVACAGTVDGDFAEQYATETDVEYGDIVAMGNELVTTETSESSRGFNTIAKLVRASSSYSDIVGVASSNYSDFTTAGYNIKTEDHPLPIALVGRVPVKVNVENGPIAIGDPIALSSVPGVGMKAQLPGMIIGYALDTWNGPGQGAIQIFIHLGWNAAGRIANDGNLSILNGDFAFTKIGTADAATTGYESHTLSFVGSGWDGTVAQDLAMKVSNEVANATDYRLSIKNTTDSEIAYITDDGLMKIVGDLVIGGKLYPSDRGMAQTDKYLYYDGSAGPGGDFMRTNAAGWATGSYDFAEMFPSHDTLNSGEVVVFGTEKEELVRSRDPYDQKVAGVISTRPGFLAGENTAGSFPVALAGRVPTNVTTENGPIAVGDPLTTSSTPGAAMRATKAGPIVGYAMEPYMENGTGKILVFVNISYWGGDMSAPQALPGTINRASQISNNQNFTSLNMEGNIYMAGNSILSMGRLVGMSDKWMIDVDGTIKTEGLIKNVITSYQNEKVETVVVTSPDVQITLTGTTMLYDGQATIHFEDVSPTFNDITSTMAPVRVIVTPNGPVALYVAQKSNNGFTVAQIDGKDSGVTFDWMVTAYRKDYEPAVSVILSEDATASNEEDSSSPSAPQNETSASTTDTTVTSQPAAGQPTAEPAVSTADTTTPVLPESVPPSAGSRPKAGPTAVIEDRTSSSTSSGDISNPITEASSTTSDSSTSSPSSTEPAPAPSEPAPSSDSTPSSDGSTSAESPPET